MDDSRYSRQISLENFGQSAKLLRQAAVAVVGAGGVAASLLPLLAGAGVGKIKLCDFDAVSLSNLHRQTLYTEAEIGRNKALAAAARLAAINSEIAIEARPDKLTATEEISEFIAGADLCITATDTFESRRNISLACAANDTREISCTAGGFTAQLFEFGHSFTFADIAPDDNAPDAKNLPIFAPAAHLSGVWGAGKALRILAQVENFQPGYFQSYDFASNIYYSSILSR